MPLDEPVVAPNFPADWLASDPREEIALQVFDRQMKDWIFKPLRVVQAHYRDHCGAVLAMVLMPFFELRKQLDLGRESAQGESGDNFKAGVELVLGIQSDAIKRQLWKALRNGLLHTMLLRDGVSLSDKYAAMEERDDSACTDPHKLLDVIELAHDAFVASATPGSDNMRKFMDLYGRRLIEAARRAAARALTIRPATSQGVGGGGTGGAAVTGEYPRPPSTGPGSGGP